MLTATLIGPATALGCGLTYLAVDYLRKVVDAPPLQIVFVFIALQIPVLAVSAWLSGDFAGVSRLAAGYWLPGLADVAAGLGANVLYLLALRRSPFSLMVPLLALIPGVTLILSGLLLGEWPTARQATGIAIVVAGLFTLYSAAGRAPARGGILGPLRAALHNLRREPGARLMAGVVILWSTTPGLDKLCVAQASVSLHGLIQVSVISAALALWIALRHGGSAFRVAAPARKPLLAAGILGGAGYVLQLVAYQMMLVAAAELIRRVSGMLGALVIGRLALNEPLSAAKVAGVLIIAVGLPLVLWA
jgi:drug/metabolite transporter (DMT)-like permease